MPYEVKFWPEAEEDLARIAKSDQALAQDILAKIRWLADNCMLAHHQPLKEDYAGLYKRRVRGKYRIIYHLDTDNAAMEVCAIGHREYIYKLG